MTYDAIHSQAEKEPGKARSSMKFGLSSSFTSDLHRLVLPFETAVFSVICVGAGVFFLGTFPSISYRFHTAFLHVRFLHSCFSLIFFPLFSYRFLLLLFT